MLCEESINILKKNKRHNFVEVPWVKEDGFSDEAGIVREPLFDACGDFSPSIF